MSLGTLHSGVQALSVPGHAMDILALSSCLDSSLLWGWRVTVPQGTSCEGSPQKEKITRN